MLEMFAHKLKPNVVFAAHNVPIVFWIDDFAGKTFLFHSGVKIVFSIFGERRKNVVNI